MEVEIDVDLRVASMCRNLGSVSRDMRIFRRFDPVSSCLLFLCLRCIYGGRKTLCTINRVLA